jgi:hypothetical protein
LEVEEIWPLNTKTGVAVLKSNHIFVVAEPHIQATRLIPLPNKVLLSEKICPFQCSFSRFSRDWRPHFSG